MAKYKSRTKLMPTLLLRLYSHMYQNYRMKWEVNDNLTQEQKKQILSMNITLLPLLAFHVRLVQDLLPDAMKLTLSQENRVSTHYLLDRFNLLLTSLLSWLIELSSSSRVENVSLQVMLWHDGKTPFARHEVISSLHRHGYNSFECGLPRG